MALGVRDEIGAVSFIGNEVYIPRTVFDCVDSSGNLYDKDSRGRVIIPRNDEDSESSEVVTSANGLVGDVEWVAGSGIKITVKYSENQIEIATTGESSTEPSPETSDECGHPGDGDFDGEGGGGVYGGGGGGGGVPADGDGHEGDTPCCGGNS